MTNLYFQIASFFCMFLVIVVYFSKKRIASAETKIFSTLTIINFGGIILDILLVFGEYIFPKHPILYFLTKFYNIYVISWLALLTIYVMYITFNDKEKFYKYNKIVKISALIFTSICSIIILVLPVEIFDENNVMYTYGPSVNFLYYSCVAYAAVIIISVLTNLKNIRNKKYMPVFALLIMIVIAFIVRQINPGLLLTTTIITYINLIMYFTIENPDIKMLHEMELAKNEAEKANKHKSDFLSSMSHEIRTPLNAIVGLSKVNIESTDSNEIKENSKDILNASNILLEIVGNVLDMSRIESGNIEMMDANYNPHDIFNSVVKVVEYRYEEKKIQLNTNIAPDIPKTLYGDYASIKKILLNLLTNAVKYTNEGHVDLVINCVNKNDVCRLIISVEDTGRGIKPEQIDKLFTKFNRLEEDRNTTTEGTGLGLAITKHIIELMGGDITVQSVYGSGSKFTVTLNQRIQDHAQLQEPLTNVSANEDTNNIKPIVEHQKPEGIFSPLNNMSVIKNKKVLIIDDNRLNLKVASKLLSSYGIQVIESNSGQNCLDRINNGEKFDLLLADEMMPNMSGTEMMKKLKEKGYKTPIVALTADVENNAREKYLSSGFDDYLKKPIEKAELDRVITIFLTF